MKIVRFGLMVMLASLVPAVFSKPVAAQTVEVLNVQPTGQVTAGQQVTVTADVNALGFDDGTVLTVSIIISNDNTMKSLTFPATVTVNKNKGTVSTKVTIPPGSTGDKGSIGVLVYLKQHPTTSGYNSNSVTWK